MAALAEVNSRLGADQSWQSLGGDALQRWIQVNGVQTIRGEYWVRRQLDDGSVALVRTQPPQAVLQAQAKAEAGIAESVYRSLDGAQVAIVKKVLFNPR